MLSRIMRSKKILTIITLLILSSVLLYVFLFNLQRTFKISETYKITTKINSETYLKVFIPVSNVYQEITDLQVEGVNDYDVEIYDGWSELIIKIPSNKSEVVITISYTAKLIRSIKYWDGEVLEEYLSPQEYVDSDNENIIKTGEQLRGSSDYETAQKIFKYVNKTMSVSKGIRVNNEQLIASELLKNPNGVCADYAILMTALLRANGIPARKISGLALSIPLQAVSDWNHQRIAHAWVEFYAEGKWHFADPIWGIFDRSDTAHLSYGTLEVDVNSSFMQNLYNLIEEKDILLMEL